MTGTRSWIEEAEAALRGGPARILRDVPLARRTSLGVGGPARLFLAPENPEEMAAAIGRLASAGVRFEFLGAGSNLLVADEGPSFVVLSTEALVAEPLIEKEIVRVGAGYMVPKLVKRVAAEGLSGIEFAEGIPGSVGGAVRMNAGWHEGMFGQAVAAFTAVSRQGVLEEIRTSAGTFTYRGSPGVGDRCVVAATLDLAPDDPARIADRMREYRDHRVSTQPTGARNAGCIFKNPPGDHAGRLIDATGLKGLAVGPAIVSDLHANFIINRGGATCREILRLVDAVRDAVLERSGVALEREVILWT
ncbi:MAG: UDP-N-acetylmuramate dehydrogenase [Acidobacteria bacterium]|nr:UDP-N-acetylmuramate dehydrogenase [Acidobacteriota bacterium]